MNSHATNDVLFRVFLPLGFVLTCLYVLYVTISRADSSDTALYIGGAIFLEILIAVLWKYEQRFFSLLMVIFLWAGLNLPLKHAWTSGRWIVLGLGAVVGFTIYIKGHSYTFVTFHLVALFAVVAALVSAMVSAYPRIAVLKVVSLLLMFLYGAAGARIAVRGREAQFLATFLLGCEVLVYISAVCYFVVGYPLYGNPNSLGVVMGLVAAPILLWGVIVSEGTRSYKRRVFALILCVLLLLSSYARSAIGGSVVSFLLVCIALRRYRLIAKGLGVAILAALLVAAAAPLSGSRTHFDFGDNSLANTFLYKGKPNEGIFGSRATPWDQTSAVIQEHPWFGSGFGTSVTDYDVGDLAGSSDLNSRSARGSTREHGNSYLAILEWTGLFGVVPFYFLVILIVVNVGRVFLWLRRTGNPFSPAVPVAAVLVAAILHATFEDWMFAPGYYMCILFWTFAFVMVDILPPPEPEPEHVPAPSVSPYLSRPWEGCGPVTPGR